MSDSAVDRKTRRGKAWRRAKNAATAGAAAAAMTVAMTNAPQASAALPVNWQIDPGYTAGTLAGIINWLGNQYPGTSVAGIYNSGPPQTVNAYLPDQPVSAGGFNTVVDITVRLFLRYLTTSDTAALYNTLGNIPQQSGAGGKCGAGFGGNSNWATNCRNTLMISSDMATLNLVKALQTQIASVSTGVTPAGYIPFTAAPNATAELPSQTNEGFALLQNPVRPNGGILTRFPGLAEALGLPSQMPAVGYTDSTDGRIRLNIATVDATWAYDPIADFPAVYNPFAITNSIWAALPLNFVGGLDGFVLSDSAGKTAAVSAIGTNLAAVLQWPINLLSYTTLGMEPGQAWYATIKPALLPIMTPAVLPTAIANFALRALRSPFLLGDPLVDIFSPAAKILVNMAYTDVLTPDELDEVDPNSTDGLTYAEEGYTAYDRTFLQSATPTRFGSVDPLTAEQKRQAIQDVVDAFIEGVKSQFAKPLWGLLVPNPDNAPDPQPVPEPVAAERVAAAPPAAPEPAPAVADIAGPPPSIESTAPVETREQRSVRASRGKAEDRPGLSAARKPAASVAADDVMKRPAGSEVKQRVSR